MARVGMGNGRAVDPSYPNHIERDFMKKWHLPVLALVAVLAFGAVPAMAGHKNVKKFGSKISVKYKAGNSNDPYKPYKKAQFYGRVHSAQKHFCEKFRKVKVFDLSTDAHVGSDFTNKKGHWALHAHNYGPGKYKAKAGRKTKTRKKTIKHGKQKGKTVKVKKVCVPTSAKIKVKANAG